MSADCAANGSFAVNEQQTQVTFSTSDNRLPISSLGGPSALRKALDGRWLYLVGDSSTRGLFFALLQQVASMRGGTLMDVTHWLNPGRGPHGVETVDLTHIAWADVVLASDGSLLEASSRKCPNPMNGLCIMPFPDGGVHPKTAWSSVASSLNSLWCTGLPSVDTSSKLSRCSLSEGQCRSPGNESAGTVEGVERPRTTGTEGSPAWRLCDRPIGRLRITFRFFAYIGMLPTDGFLELRSRWWIPPPPRCTLVGNVTPTRAHSVTLTTGGSARTTGDEVATAACTAQLWKAPRLSRAPDLHLLQVGSWDDAQDVTDYAHLEPRLLRGLSKSSNPPLVRAYQCRGS